VKKLRSLAGIVVPVAFFGAVGAYVWSADGGSELSNADREIVAANVVHDLPAGARAIGASFGQGLELAAALPESESALPGEETKVVLYWRASARVEGPTKVFAHLDGPDGTRQNLDHHPVYGLHRVQDFRPGEIVRDELWIAFPARAARGEWVLWVGLFSEEAPYARLEVENPTEVTTDGADRVRAAAWEVR